MEALAIMEEAMGMVERFGRGFARYGLPGMVLGILVTWAWGFHGEQAVAQAPNTAGRSAPAGGAQGRPVPAQSGPSAKGVTAGEAGGILALIANQSVGPPVQWLYLIDTKKRAFAIYRVDPTNPQGCVKLEASRQFRWDLDLDQYNNQGLEPADVKARVDALNRSNP
jgi:hypothetical protein